MNRFNRISCLCIPTVMLAISQCASALILVGGAGPVTDQNWPAGSVEVANRPSRVRFTEGPPFGGGETTFQYVGDAAALNDVLARFAKIDAPVRSLVIHVGAGRNPVTTEDEREAGGDRVSWTFTVWNPRSYYRLYSDLSGPTMADDSHFHAPLPPPRIDVWADSPGLDISKMQIPPGLTVTDERAVSHGYKPADGSVIAGVAYDLLTSKPVPNVEVVITRFGDVSDSALQWSKVASAVGDAAGRFELKKIPPGDYYAVTLRAPGYASREIDETDMGPGTFKNYTARLSPAITQKGIVVDFAGKPLANITMQVNATVAIDGSGYSSVRIGVYHPVTTDAAGRFTLTDLPEGLVRMRACAAHYCQLDPLRVVAVPSGDLTLSMTRTGTIHVTARDAAGKPMTGNITITDQRPDKIGTWGGSAALDANGTCILDGIPPAKYKVFLDRSLNSGKPSPKLIEVKPDQTAEVELTAP